MILLLKASSNAKIMIVIMMCAEAVDSKMVVFSSLNHQRQKIKMKMKMNRKDKMIATNICTEFVEKWRKVPFHS